MSEQLELGGMPTKLHRCTPTSLTTWLDCPKRFRLSYVERPMPPKGPPWAHNSLGAAVHNALRDWWDLPIQRRVPEAADALMRDRWLDEGFRDAEQATQWRHRATEWVRSYLATLDPLDEPIGIERTVAARTPTLALSGRIDRLDERADGLVVVDYKTGRRPLDVGDARSSMALAVYAYAAGLTLRRPSGAVELHHLPTGTVVVWHHTQESMQRHLDRAAAIAEEIVDAADRASAGEPLEALYPARPGPLCGWCDFRAACDDGRAAAGVPKPTWAGLDEPSEDYSGLQRS